MAILLLTGTPGAGKSYSAVALTIVPALNLGRPIRTNIPLQWDEIAQVWPDADCRPFEPSPEAWASFPGGSLVVLDEVGNIFPAGERADRANPEAREWIAMHRHRIGPVGDRQLSQEIVLISQGSADIAKWVRSKIDKTYIIQKLDAVGAEKRYRCDIYQGWQDTHRPIKRAHVRGYTGKYEDKYTRLYQSHTQAKEHSAVSVEELRADKKATVWSSGTMKAAVIAPFIAAWAIWYAVSHVGDFLGAGNGAAAPVAKAQPERQGADVTDNGLKPRPPLPPDPGPVPLPAPDRPAAKPAPQPSAESDDWRLVASMTAGDARKWAVVVARGKDRRSLVGVDCELRHGEPWCFVDGEWVSGHTGNAPDIWAIVNPENGGAVAGPVQPEPLPGAAPVAAHELARGG